MEKKVISGILVRMGEGLIGIDNESYLIARTALIKTHEGNLLLVFQAIPRPESPKKLEPLPAVRNKVLLELDSNEVYEIIEFDVGDSKNERLLH